ncbi:hypothetical protein V1264_015193 [Littorina saxatilis]|uniref:Uncharacterized protein n=1 Tax=Littorina saxatilis TaxID=31220 RepID=A0AAN9BKH5_9CAEN
MGRRIDTRTRRAFIEALRQHRRYRMLQDRVSRLVEAGSIEEHLNDLLKPSTRRRDRLFQVNGRRVPYSLTLAYHLAQLFPDTQAEVYVRNESGGDPVLVQRAWVEALNEPVPSSPGEADHVMEMITAQPAYTWLRHQAQGAALQGQLPGFTQQGQDFSVQGQDSVQAHHQLVNAQDDLISTPAAGLFSPAWESQEPSSSASDIMEVVSNNQHDVSNTSLSDDSGDSDITTPVSSREDGLGGLRKRKRGPVVSRDNSQESKAKRKLSF